MITLRAQRFRAFVTGGNICLYKAHRVLGRQLHLFSFWLTGQIPRTKFNSLCLSSESGRLDPFKDNSNLTAIETLIQLFSAFVLDPLCLSRH